MDKVDTRVSGSRDMDLRKWIQQDGFTTDFLLKCSDDADQTTLSAVTESTASPEPTETTTPEEPTEMVPPLEEVPKMPSSSTPVPMEDRECLRTFLDEIRQANSSIGDLKAEFEALNSKMLLLQLEHKDLKVIFLIHAIRF